jgi:hypothetical protein
MQLLCTALRAVAVQGQRHVGLDHHVNKVSMCDAEAHVGNLVALRGAISLAANARWAFTLARLKPETAEADGIPETELKRYRRLDPLKASYGPDDDATRLLRIESVIIANGEQVGVLVEVDTQRAREEGAEHRATAKEDWQRRLAAALTAMLGEKKPRSVNDAATWLTARHPDLFVGKAGSPLSQFTVRQRLPAAIGSGLDTTSHGRPARIVLRDPTGPGRGGEIEFEQLDAL